LILPASTRSGAGGFSIARARKEQKAEQVELLTEKLKKAKVAVLTDYRGPQGRQIQELRSKLRGADVEYRVVRTARPARRGSRRYPALKEGLKGPVAIAFGYDDLSVASRLINEFVRATRLKVDVVGGSSRSVFSPDQVKASWLTCRPARLHRPAHGHASVTVAQLVGIMQTPLQQLFGVLEAYKTKLEAA